MIHLALLIVAALVIAFAGFWVLCGIFYVLAHISQLNERWLHKEHRAYERRLIAGHPLTDLGPQVRGVPRREPQQ